MSGFFSDSESTPSLSFAELGDTHEIVVTGIDQVQDRDFQTQQPKTWDNGDPKMVGVIQGDKNGELVSLWVRKSKAPGSMFEAIKEAQREAGKDLEPGDTLKIQHHATAPAQTKGFNPRKLYKAKIIAGASEAPF